jgi:glycosyltransferase involved in cell wall biosynthesis
MRIAIATNFLYPEGLGGTELYCHQLSTSLLQLGHEVYWFVPNFDKPDTQTGVNNDGVRIVRFAAIEKGKLPHATFVAQSFIRELNQRSIQVVHFNEFGGFEGMSTSLLRETHKAGIRTIVTMHLVHYICLAGTLRRGGIQPCDGVVIPNRCAGCIMFSDRHTPLRNALRISKLYHKAANIADKLKLSFSRFPAFRKVYKTLYGRLDFISTLNNHADEIVSLTQNFRDVLIRNGIHGDKISCIGQGAPQESAIQNRSGNEMRKNYVFVSRVHKEKGIGLLLKAAKQLRELAPDVRIDLYGPLPANDDYTTRFIRTIEGMDNIQYKGVLEPSDVRAVLSNYKAVLLPSYVAEMAPLTIMEALSEKTIAIASDVPGSSELVRSHDAGLVFEYGSSDDLVNKIMSVEKGNNEFAFIAPENKSFMDIAVKYELLYRPRTAVVN